MTKLKFLLLLGLLLFFSLGALWYLQPTIPRQGTALAESASTTTSLTTSTESPRPTLPADVTSPATETATTTTPAHPSPVAAPLAVITESETIALAAIPASVLKSELLLLTPAARMKALTKLRRIAIPVEDFASLRVLPDGNLYYVNDIPPPLPSAPQTEASPLPENSAGNPAAIAPPPTTAAAAVPTSSPPARSSRLGSTNVIYLDFNGHTITGTSWNSSVASYLAKPYDTDSSPSTFSDNEQSDIIEIWERVAEDFSPFDVNVTTVEPSVFTSTTARAMITASVDANGVNMPSSSAGGVAQLDVFGEPNFVTRNSPSFVYFDNFSNNEANIAEAVSHEIGHNMGLTHDGQTGVEYYSGHGSGNTSWGPLMGTGYGRNVSQWSKGEYLNANNTQDDFVVLEGKMGYRSEAAGDTIGTAAALAVTGSTASDSGVISSATDIDLYSFSTASGTISFAVNSYRVSTGTHGGNADLIIELLDSTGSVVATHEPSGTTNANLTFSATAGTYYIRISPDGDGTPTANPASGYTLYGSTGQYTLTGTIMPAAPNITSTTTASVEAGATFSYSIVGTNAPSSYGATGLPSGLTVDPATGIISGRPTAAGTFPLSLAATNSLGSGTATLTLTVHDAAPAITDLSSNRIVVEPGDSPTLFVTALSANGSPTYQWQHNGRTLSGATGASLTLSAVSRSASGYYRVLVTNTIGTTRSSAVFLIVAPTSTQLLIWGGNDEGQATLPTGLGATAQISLGSEFTTALLRDGTIAAWGSNNSGQADAPSSVTDAVQVDCGNFHALALKADGTVVGWGNSAHDQDTPPTGLTEVVAVAAGGNHSLALKNDGTVVAWGQNNRGQATVPGGLTDVIGISAGNEFSLAVKSDGTVVGWGFNTDGQTTVSASATATVAVSAGREFSLALQSDGSLVSWGDNGFQQRTLPTGLTTFAAVVAGSYHTVGLNPDGTVAAWGYNAETQRDVPTGLGQVFSISAGRFNSAAVRDATGDVAPTISNHPTAQTVVEATPTTLTVVASGGTSLLSYQWRKGGVAISGATSASLELTAPVFADSGDYDVVVSNEIDSIISNIATLIVNALPAISSQSAARINLAPGATLALSVEVSGTGALSYQWYHNGLAISGQSTDAYHKSGFAVTDAGVYHVLITDDIGVRRSASMFVLYTPANAEVVGWGLNTSLQTTPPSGLDDAIAVTTGSTHSLALKADGTVVAWGSNNRGETTVPGSLTDVVKIAAGDDVSFALKSDGTLTVWGRPGFTIATPPASLSDVVDIACLGFHALALTADGSVVGWGSNDNGQITIPFNLGTVIAIGAGNSTSYAINTDGTLFAWGSGNNGETTVPAASTLWRTLSGGGFHALGLKSDGTIEGWGFSPYVTPPSELTGIVAVAAGYRHSLGLSSAGLITAWGANDSGEGTIPSGLDRVFALAAGENYSLAIKEIQLPAAPAITSQPADQTVTAGSAASFTVVASGFPAPTYQWRKNGEIIPGATDALLQLSNIETSDAADYDVVVTNSVSSVTSEAATLTVNTAPTISMQPQSATVTVGTQVTLTVVATGTPAPSYQWRKNGGAITGAISNSLDLGTVALTAEGNFDVVVTNIVDSVTSTVAEIVIQEAPSITGHPVSQTVLAGATVTFSVTATGTPSPSYLWEKDGATLDGATTATLSLGSATTSLTGNYTVLVFNDVATVTSEVAALSVVEVTGTHLSDGYRADGTVTISNTITYVGPVTKLVWSTMPPATIGGQNWTFNRSAGTAADTAPLLGNIDLLEWTWNTVPTSPFTFTYTLGIPAATTGNHNLTAMVEVTSSAGPLQSVATPDSLVLSAAATFHTADTDKDFGLNLSELLRVIELYNTRLGTTRTGRYKVDAASTDGFAPDPTSGTTQANFHSADTNRDSHLSLSELLRVIELYNTRSGTTRTGAYQIDTTTTDGFAPGPNS
jgi:alpha-tubulin suppressor-like RCC1 family protein